MGNAPTARKGSEMESGRYPCTLQHLLGYSCMCLTETLYYNSPSGLCMFAHWRPWHVFDARRLGRFAGAGVNAHFKIRVSLQMKLCSPADLHFFLVDALREARRKTAVIPKAELSMRC